MEWIGLGAQSVGFQLRPKMHSREWRESTGLSLLFFIFFRAGEYDFYRSLPFLSLRCVFLQRRRKRKWCGRQGWDRSTLVFWFLKKRPSYTQWFFGRVHMTITCNVQNYESTPIGIHIDNFLNNMLSPPSSSLSYSYFSSDDMRGLTFINENQKRKSN